MDRRGEFPVDAASDMDAAAARLLSANMARGKGGGVTTDSILVLLRFRGPAQRWQVFEVSRDRHADKLRGLQPSRIVVVCYPCDVEFEPHPLDEVWRYLRHEVLEPMAHFAGISVEVKG